MSKMPKMKSIGLGSIFRCFNTTATYIPHPPPDLPLERGGIGKPSMKVRKPHKIPSPSGVSFTHT